MASIYEIISSDGVIVREFLMWMRCWYVDANDPTRRDPIFRQVAYCKRCEDFIHAELFLTATECERIIEREQTLDDEGGEWLRVRKLLHGSHEQFAEHLRTEVLRMPERRSPPRCLMCGSVEILVTQSDRYFDEHRMPHPEHPHGLRVRWVGFADTELDVDEAKRRYDREGNLIRLDDE